jgi:serine/threonine-protein kinase
MRMLAGLGAVAALAFAVLALTRQDATDDNASRGLAGATAAPAAAPADQTPVAAPTVPADTAPPAVATAAGGRSANPESPTAKARAAAKPRPAQAVAESKPAAAPVLGTLQLAISPWGEVEVDGESAGTTPPLTRLTLSEGTHTVTVRNADFPPYTATVKVQADKPSTVRHRFGS